MRKNILLALFAANLLFSCAKTEQEPKNKLNNEQKSSTPQELKKIKASLGFDKIQYYPNNEKSWRVVLKFYQELPQKYLNAGYTNSLDLHNLKTHTLGMLLAPNMYAAFLSNEQPTQEEAILMAQEWLKVDIWDNKTKAIIYKYLKWQNLALEADNFAQVAKNKGGNISEVEATLQKLSEEMEKSISNKNAQVNSTKKYKLSVIKKLLGN
jgi:hypothetical protein